MTAGVARAAASSQVPSHGYAGYRAGCRCYVCGFAVSQYEQNRKKAITAGTWHPFADADRVREHLAQLSAAGIGYKRAADLASVGQTTVASLLFGRRGNPPSPRVRTEIAERLLAVQTKSAPPANGQLIDGTGVARRIQALCAIGWSLTRQAERIGWGVGNYAALTSVRPVRVTTARKIAAMYDELSMSPPAKSASSTRACRLAAARGWVPPLAWDDEQLDDPAARPSGRAATPLEATA